MSRSTNFFTKEYLLCRDRVGAMIFLLFCLCYGYQTSQIPLFPGDEYEPFTARTLPTILTSTTRDKKQRSIAKGCDTSCKPVELALVNRQQQRGMKSL